MKLPLRLLAVTYRWGEDIVGGAELHLRRLLLDLVESGHSVTVWTTTGKEIPPLGRWAVDWQEGYPPGDSVDQGIAVRRFPIKRPNRLLLALGCRALQRRYEREERNLDPGWFGAIASGHCPSPGGHLLNGWHLPEASGDGIVRRWTTSRARLLLHPADCEGTLRLRGYAPARTLLSLEVNGTVIARHSVKRDFDVTTVIPDGPASGIVLLRVDRLFVPPSDTRSLGVMVHGIEWRPEDSLDPVAIDLGEDHRSLGRRAPLEYARLLAERAEARDPAWGRLFDWLRGPNSPELAKALRTATGFDAVLAANLPWNTIPLVARECPLPLLAMPLWHIEDDYYFWRHYREALGKARLVLANTAYSAEQFFAPLGIKASFIGPGVLPPPEPAADFSPTGWRIAHGLAPDEQVVLTVCRKSSEKRYDVVAAAVEKLRAGGRAARCVLVGPDLDGRPVPAGTLCLGSLSGRDLDSAYRSCDVFVLMSESESFGMVLAEAWLRGKPVVANRLCGPAASLVAEGTDGFLAGDAAELADILAKLLDDPALRERLGEAGRQKSETTFVQRAATQRFLSAVEAL